MKKIKLVLTALLALLMTFTGMPVASAATTYTLSLTGTTTGHTYEAYQIFSGDLSGDTLSNIQWGSGVDATAVTAALGEAATKAEALNGKSNDAADAKAFAQAVSAYLKSTPTKTVQSASGTTTFTGLEAGYYLIKDKTASLAGKEGESYTRFILQVVKDTTATVKASVPTFVKEVKDNATGNYTSATDYSIGDNIPFQLTATLPSNYDAYSEYELTFNDTLSSGLTYNNDARVFLVNGGSEVNVSSAFAVSITGNKVVVRAANLKATLPSATASSKLVVRYTAKLNDTAATGTVGNHNTASITYSNNPNTTGGKTTGETPKSKATVFTYELVVDKVNESQSPLQGAGFTLFKKVNGSYTEVKKFTASTATKFTFKGLEAGDYKLVESTTPAGYNTMADIEFTVSSTINTAGANPTLTALSATSAKATFTTTLSSGTIATKIINKKGSLLPNTGGIGTTILYIIGSCLVLGAIVLLFARKRVNTK